MEILRKEESREQCTEAGWYAYDYLLAQPMEKAQIERLSAFGGSLLYLSALKQPFYKLEGTHFMVKGLQGQNTLRFAVYREEEQALLAAWEKFLEDVIK